MQQLQSESVDTTQALQDFLVSLAKADETRSAEQQAGECYRPFIAGCVNFM